MRKIISKTTGEDLIEEFESVDPDLPIFNKVMLDKGFDKIKSFEVLSKGFQIKTDLVNGTITIDGVEQDLELDAATKLKLKDNLLKWINFRRVTISMRMDGLKSRSHKYGVGFQTTIDGQNLKRFVLVDSDEKILVKE